MKTPKEIGELARQRFPIDESERYINTDFVALRIGFIEGYSKCQKDNTESQMELLLAWWMGKGDEYRTKTLFVDAVKDFKEQKLTNQHYSASTEKLKEVKLSTATNEHLKLAVEFGYIQCEKGNNIEKAMIEFNKLSK